MSTSTTAKLIYVANQIATFFDTQPGGAAVAQTADHLRAFWTPSMRRELIAHATAGGEGLSPTVKAAVELLEAPRGSVRAELAAAGEKTARRPGDDAG